MELVVWAVSVLVERVEEVDVALVIAVVEVVAAVSSSVAALFVVAPAVIAVSVVEVEFVVDQQVHSVRLVKHTSAYQFLLE